MRRLAVYFFGGAAMDAIIAEYYIQIGQSRVISASILAAAITVFSVLFINGILDRTDRRRKMMALAAYALGNGVGTALAMVLR